MPEMKFAKLAGIFHRLEGVSSSLAMIDILADFFPKISPEEAKISAYLLRGEIAPAYEGLEIGLAEKMVIRAIILSQNVSAQKINDLFKKKGDLGSVIEILKASEKGKGLTIKEVFEKLIGIAGFGGSGSQEKKINFLADLLSKTSGQEAKYIIRTILGTLRLGVGEMIFLYGLAKAFSGNPTASPDEAKRASKKNKEVLEYAFNVISDLGEVAYAVSKFGIKKIAAIEPRAGVPIRMMSANRIEGLGEIEKHIKGKVSVEDKYDGERLQSHIKKDGEIVIFSRRQENITHQYPDVIEGLKKTFKGKETIIEGEVVSYNERENKFLPFQVLMSRRRKHNVLEYVEKIPVRYFLFDLLYLDGRSFLKKSLKERKLALKGSFSKTKAIDFADYVITNDLALVKKCFNESMKRGNEGVMIKDYSGIYQAGTRGWLWIKFKKEYEEELADTFDLVVVGGIYGSGRRAKTYGSLLVAAYNPKNGKYYSFTKVGTGFTDETLARLMKMFEKYKLEEKHKMVETKMKVDVWFEPKIVMEISGAEITISPIHTVAEEKLKRGGLALRFPKFLRWREDKSSEEATTVEEIYDLYKK
jgi:DNA ligase-1